MSVRPPRCPTPGPTWFRYEVTHGLFVSFYYLLPNPRSACTVHSLISESSYRYICFSGYLLPLSLSTHLFLVSTQPQCVISFLPFTFYRIPFRHSFDRIVLNATRTKLLNDDLDLKFILEVPRVPFYFVLAFCTRIFGDPGH